MNEQAIFYSGTRNASSWALRAWLALRTAGFPFHEVIIDIRRPQRFANLAGIATISPAAAVPVLTVGGKTIFESTAIMEFANDYCGGNLLPTDRFQRAHARSLVAWQHAGLSGICSRISFESAFYPYKRALSDQEQVEAGRFFAHVETILSETSGPYLFGKAGLGDFMLAPAVIRLARHEVSLDAYPNAARWTAALLANDLVAEWLAQADQLPHIWYDEYLIPGEPPGLYKVG